MRIYYNMSFKADEKPEGLYFDAIAFNAQDGHRYSIDITGDHDFETKAVNIVKCKKRCNNIIQTSKNIYETSGRVKGDCNQIIRLDTEDIDYETITYSELYKLLSTADTDNLEFVLCAYDKLKIIDYISYEIEIELNGCKKITFIKVTQS